MSSNRTDYNSFELPYQNDAGFGKRNDTGFDYNDADFDQYDDDNSKSKRTRNNPTPRGNQQPSCCLFGCTIGCIGFLSLLFLGGVAFYYCMFSGAAPLAVSPETTIITGPLKDDGTVDFHQAIKDKFEPTIHPNENGFRDVLIAFGREIFEIGGSRHNTDWQYLKMCQELEIDPHTPPLFSIRNPDDPHSFELCRARLDAVLSAVAKSAYFIPLVRQSERDLVMASQPRAVYSFHATLHRLLQNNASARFASGDTAEGWKSTLASIRLFRFITINQAWLHMIADSDAGAELLLTPVDKVVATFPQWTTPQLDRAIADLEALPNWHDRQTTLQIMHFQLLDMLSGANDLRDLVSRSGGHPAVQPEMLDALQLISFDWNYVARELNRAIKDYGELLEQSPWNNLEEQFEILELRYIDEPRNIPLTEEELTNLLVVHIETTGDLSLNPLFVSGRSKLTGFLVGHLATWAVGEMYRLQIIEESRSQALRLALILERFRRDRERYPDSLEELGVIPNMELQYEKRVSGGYRIWNKVFQLVKE